MQTFTESPAAWQPPVELQRSTPRPAQYTRRGRNTLIVAVLIGVAGFALGGWLIDKASKDARRWQQWKSEAVTTRGRVTNLEQIGSSSKNRKYRAEYIYAAGGDEYSGSSEINSYEYGTLRRGDNLDVQYRKSDPETSWLPGHEPTGMRGWVGPLVGGLMLLLAAGLIWGVQIHRKFIEEGWPVSGRVTKITIMRTRNGGVGGYRVEYVFQTSTGQSVTGKTSLGNNPPAEGAEITVMYMPENPGRNAPYPLDLARVAV